MTNITRLLGTTLVATAVAAPVATLADSIPSVVVTIENLAPSVGTFQTPVWIGIHDGSFDSYNGGKSANIPLGADEIERLAEDGNTGPISATFEQLLPGAPQATVLGPAGPFAPGDRSRITLQVGPSIDRYFSYASMLIPSNDAFVANDNPLAHPLFDDNGKFIGEPFIVAGREVNDAGTEGNDEIAANTAFLNQASPNTGVTENEPVSQHGGFAAPGVLTYSDGVLNHPPVSNGNFRSDGYRTLRFDFRYVDLNRRTRFAASLSTDQEVQSEVVDSKASGEATIISRKGAQEVVIRVHFSQLTGPLSAAHLHFGPAGVNGPIVVDLASGIRPKSNRVRFIARAQDVTGPLGAAPDPLLALLNELAAGNIYINLHTAAFPDGELRGQVEFP